MARPCLFCDQNATTKEHAWPKWIAKHLGLRQQYFDIVNQTGAIPPRKQRISIASYRRKMLCKGCQEHYKHLEDRVIPILLPMARGEYVPLWAWERGVLAEWATKTAYTVFDFHGIADDRTKEHRYTLRATGRPADNVFVGYAPYRGNPRSTFTMLPLDPDVIEHPPAVGEPPTAYNYIGAFGSVAFKVFGMLFQEPGDRIETPAAGVFQVWPDTGNDTILPDALAPFVDKGLVRLSMMVPVSGRPQLWDWPVTPPQVYPP